MRDLSGVIILQKYRLLRALANSERTSVYEAENVQMGKRVAVKVLENTEMHTQEVIERFTREVKASSAVEDEHIVQAFDTGFDPSIGLFLVMELLKGEDLQSRVRRSGPLPVAFVVELGIQVAQALSKAHVAGLIHRDIRPNNLFLVQRSDDMPFVKVVDFGVVKLRSSGVDKTLTAVGTLLGSTAYTAPEQAQGSSAIDQRADLWSVGAVLYEALSGRPPYPEYRNILEYLRHLSSARPAPISQLAPGVPPELAGLIDNCLEVDVTRRVPDAVTLASRLLRIRDQLRAPDPVAIAGPVPVAPSQPGSVQAHEVPAGVPRGGGMAAGVVGGVIASLVIVASAGGVLFWKLRPAPTVAPTTSATAGAASVAPVQAPTASVAVVVVDAGAVPDPRRGGKVVTKGSKDGGAERVEPPDAGPTAAKDGGTVKPPASASAQPASSAPPKTPKARSVSWSAPNPAPASS